MVSERVAREEVTRVRKEIARGRTLAGLIGQLWKQAEDLARNAGKSKKSQTSHRNRCGAQKKAGLKSYTLPLSKG
mgnify:CR=1 FL=1